ncbi:MAG: GNAT family N-acetyltransferase [Chitinophagaceae bacterium]
MKPVFTTENLYFSRFVPADADSVLELNSDPLVTRFTHDIIYTRAQAEEVVNRSLIPHYEQYGYGRWAVRRKSDDRFVGWCGLKFRPATGLIDLGYRFISQFWGRGYATEAAKATTLYAFNELKISLLTAAAEPENTASVRILTRCGFQETGYGEVDGFPVILFQLHSLPL